MLQYGEYGLWITSTDVLKQCKYVLQLIYCFPFSFSEGIFLAAAMTDPTFSLGVSCT